MAEDRGETSAGSARNPNALSVAARLLAGVSGEPVTEEMIRADLEAGARLQNLADAPPAQLDAFYHSGIKHHQSTWLCVMCLTGVDYFSTLRYQPCTSLRQRRPTRALRHGRRAPRPPLHC